MNRNVFFAFVIVAATLVFSLSVLAADGAIPLTAYPIHIMVNGELFQPKDVDGKDIAILNIDGVTYAPARALAEAYGLEVGYDAEQNLVTVDSPDESGKVVETEDLLKEFTDQWTVTSKPVTHYGDEKIFTATYSGSLSMADFKEWWKGLGYDVIQAGAEQLAAEAQDMVGGLVTMYFDYHGYSLGTAYARGSFTSSNFVGAGVWIK